MNKNIYNIARILLGIMLVVFGANKFLNFMPQPTLPESALNFMMALVSSGYIMVIVGVIEIAAGILILSNRWTNLALVILFPISLNAVLFHLFLDPAGMGGAVVLITLNVYLLFANKITFRPILAMR